jgi:hypothetical protein
MDEIEFDADFTARTGKHFGERLEEVRAEMEELHSEKVKWQPVMLILLGGRVECPCGNQAIFIAGKVVDDTSLLLDHVEMYCQQCYQTAQNP